VEEGPTGYTEAMQQLPGTLPLYTAAEMRTLDRIAVEEIGIPAAVLMERAGLGAAAEILTWFGDAQRIAVVCGAGNNGGDGFVIARHLAAAGRDVRILLCEPESKVRRESKVNLEIARKLELEITRVNATAWRKALQGTDLVVDAMLGTGASGAPRPHFDLALDAIERSMLPVVSVDVPSGVDASTGEVETRAVQADLTVTFHAPKIGLAVAPGRFHAGRVKVVDIGIPASIEPTSFPTSIATDGVLDVVPPRQRDGSKYDSGVVTVVGGATGMSGAIALAGRAAMRAGAGVVFAAVPEPIAQELDSAVAEVQFRGAIADADGRLTVGAAELIESLTDRAGAVAFGPGLGRSDQTRALARWVLKVQCPLVLDADGLRAFDGELASIAARDGRPTVLTPHEGELAGLLGAETTDVHAHRLESVRAAAVIARAVVLLKGEDTIVADPSGQVVVVTGHRSQATAGTGDVLAGTVAALLARGLPPLAAAACGARATARAAESAAQRFAAAGVVAGDLLDRLPAALDRGADLLAQERPA
jgi:NAD(P)H-hydrate epimerase